MSASSHRVQHRAVILTSLWRADAIARALAVGRARRCDRAVELIQITAQSSVPKTAVKGCDLACRARPAASCAWSAAASELFEVWLWSLALARHARWCQFHSGEQVEGTLFSTTAGPIEVGLEMVHSSVSVECANRMRSSSVQERRPENVPSTRVTRFFSVSL